MRESSPSKNVKINMAKIPPNRRKTAYRSLRKIAERLGVPFIVRPPAKPPTKVGEQDEVADPKR
jgi:predicted TIM-barrel fold metal-dependent hydrolase